jgi:hypothetical protein
MDNKLLGLLGIGVAAYLLLNKKKDETVAIVSNTEPTLPPTEPIVVPPSMPIYVEEPIIVTPQPTFPPIDTDDPITILPPPPQKILGCTDSNANNFAPGANTDDGSCTYTVFGCTNPRADNFNPNANSDDGTCYLTPPPMPIAGCMDPSALNYDSLAVADDGSCQYPPVQIVGCTDPLADNYNPNATVGCSTSPNSGNVVTNVNTGLPYSSGFDGTFMIGDY